VGRPAGPRVNLYAGRARVWGPHKMCGAGRAGPRCVGLMGGGPARIATPNI